MTRTDLGWFMRFILALLFAGVCEAADRPPNVVFLIADDLGYGELGCFGQEIIRTPNIDRLAAEGLKMTRHYAGNPVCATSRCVLMTGKHPGHAFIRDNREWKPEGQYPIPDSDVTIAEVLGEAGYVSGGFGKWGLGGPDTDGRPTAQGFDRFFGYNCQRVAHTFYPTYLWDNDARFPLDNGKVPGHGKLAEDADPGDPAAYSRFKGDDYAPDIISSQARAWLRQNADRPFFLYYPTTVPHLALQVPDEELAAYEEAIPEDPPYPGGKGYAPHISPRRAYAAMITRLDREVGRILDLLEELGVAGNTVVVFTSDNGPTYDRLGGSDSVYFDSAGGLRGLKGSMYEGGVRVPTLVRWPGVTRPETETDHLSGFEDWLPTFAAAAGTGPPKTDGVDLRPVLAGEAVAPRDFLYREFAGYGGFQAVWSGDRKAVRTDLNRKGKLGLPVETELYDLENDRDESDNIAAAHPDVVKRLEAVMAREHEPSDLFPLLRIDGVAAKP